MLMWIGFLLEMEASQLEESFEEMNRKKIDSYSISPFQHGTEENMKEIEEAVFFSTSKEANAISTNNTVFLMILLKQPKEQFALYSVLVDLFPSVQFSVDSRGKTSDSVISLDEGYWIHSSFFITCSCGSFYRNVLLWPVHKGQWSQVRMKQANNSTLTLTLNYPERRGFHNQLQIRGISSNMTDILILCPKGMYVDKDGLYEQMRKNNFPSFTTYPSFIDIESSSSQATPFLLVLSFPPTSSVHFQIPVHLRYAFASEEVSSNDYAIHTMFLCNKETFVPLVNQRILFQIPTGSLSHIPTVLPITVGILLTSTLLLLCTFLR